jgi:hypothetical protein
MKGIQQCFDSGYQGRGLREGTQKQQRLMEADERPRVAELVTSELVEQDLYFCGCATAEVTLSGVEASEPRVEGWRHVDSGWSV